MTLADPPEPSERAQPEPWGFWGSLGVALLGVLLVVLAQLAALMVLAFLAGARMARELPRAELESMVESGEAQELAQSWISQGDALALYPLLALPIVGVVLWALVRLRGGGDPRREIGLVPVAPRRLARWFGLLLVFSLAYAALNEVCDRPDFPQAMLDIFDSAASLPLLALAVALLAPIVEELVFRGPALSSMARSRAGPWLAVVITSALWAAIHTQYDTYEVTQIFLLGLLLGASRTRTGSIVPALSMHVFVNAWNMAAYVALRNGAGITEAAAEVSPSTPTP